ncbi:hypothetical protein GCM10009799_19350 [Nocardiopsis rhodophaea]|uniref:Uncharacterized protein n=1 Tax=Nocardiopsis rhodophaea TaxID=280238 RepID=A0ABN2SW08_9ACTN
MWANSFVLVRRSFPFLNPLVAQSTRPRPPTGGYLQRRGGPRIEEMERDFYSFFFAAQARTSNARVADEPVKKRPSALTLLVARVRANDHDSALAADDTALRADLLDARLDLHGVSELMPSRYAVSHREGGRRARAYL